MRHKLKYIAVLGFGAVLYSSCKRELLEPQLQTSVSDASAFDTPTRISNLVLSLYSSLKSGSFYGGRGVVYGDIRGEDFINETSNLVTASDVWNLNLANSATSVKSYWSAGYNAINNCNIFLDGMAAKGSAVVGATLANNYIAEARLIRALSYYSLLQVFARPYADGAGAKPGLPLRLKGIVGPGFSDLERSTVAEVYTQILSDLDFAETNLPVTNSSAYNNVTRAHRNTAIALKTRVYLSMQKYDKVITEANKIVTTTPPFTATSGVAHALQADITNVFKTPYTTTESIMSMPMTTTSGDFPGTQNSLCSYFYMAGSTPGATEFSLNPNGILANAGWTATDKRKSLIFTNTAGKKFVSKYTTGSPYTDYVPVIRYAEVLLNLAEAKVRNSNTVDAQSLLLLNAVRGRSDASTVLAPATVPALLDAILTERRIEFFGEGLRNIDLMRLMQTIPSKGSAPTKAPSDAGYIWPISSDELSLNRLMKDN
ncbi:RagB/SusD family nutrient uptake outer membrane protein [Sediminibacterium ginsengisoli]|uniref:SusD family protein n=1 Tax=Sediminibacterium ginsengisoli TaxID=413434 RepID=A0A1T4NP93_9BACT|nr:RagB/SusD family nutrient uptake outer membrane protein [Sediminibacterium ginsengisoli]SJZ81033.1 SusD family protein [Sediminibacterium ginsengisoli]